MARDDCIASLDRRADLKWLARSSRNAQTNHSPHYLHRTQSSHYIDSCLPFDFSIFTQSNMNAKSIVCRHVDSFRRTPNQNRRPSFCLSRVSFRMPTTIHLIALVCCILSVLQINAHSSVNQVVRVNAVRLPSPATSSMSMSKRSRDKESSPIQIPRQRVVPFSSSEAASPLTASHVEAADIDHSASPSPARKRHWIFDKKCELFKARCLSRKLSTLATRQFHGRRSRTQINKIQPNTAVTTVGSKRDLPQTEIVAQADTLVPATDDPLDSSRSIKRRRTSSYNLIPLAHSSNPQSHAVQSPLSSLSPALSSDSERSSIPRRRQSLSSSPIVNRRSPRSLAGPTWDFENSHSHSQTASTHMPSIRSRDGTPHPQTLHSASLQRAAILVPQHGVSRYPSMNSLPHYTANQPSLHTQTSQRRTVIEWSDLQSLVQQPHVFILRAFAGRRQVVCIRNVARRDSRSAPRKVRALLI